MVKIGKNRAIKIYISTFSVVRQTLNRLSKWDENLTQGDNAKNLGITSPAANRIAIRYGLKCKRLRNNGSGRKPDLKKKQAYKDLQAMGWTLKEIGRIFKTKHQNIQQTLARKS